MFWSSPHLHHIVIQSVESWDRCELADSAGAHRRRRTNPNFPRTAKVHRDKVIFLAANHLNDLSCGGVTLFDIEEKNRHYAP